MTRRKRKKGPPRCDDCEHLLSAKEVADGWELCAICVAEAELIDRAIALQDEALRSADALPPEIASQLAAVRTWADLRGLFPSVGEDDFVSRHFDRLARRELETGDA